MNTFVHFKCQLLKPTSQAPHVRSDPVNLLKKTGPRLGRGRIQKREDNLPGAATGTGLF
jgi:hypothetical protein